MVAEMKNKYDKDNPMYDARIVRCKKCGHEFKLAEGKSELRACPCGPKEGIIVDSNPLYFRVIGEPEDYEIK